MEEEGKAIEISYSYARTLVTFFLGFHIVTTGNMFLFLTLIQKKKNIKTFGNLIYQMASCFNVLSYT
jgi:hypothetical protein